MYGTIGILLLLAVIPFLFTEAYANHYTDFGLDDVFTWREHDNDNIENVWCQMNNVMEDPFDTERISLECKHGTYDGEVRQGAMYITKVLPKALISNGTSNLFTWTFANQCVESICPDIRMAIMDGVYTHSSLIEPGGFPNNPDYDGLSGGACFIDWEDITGSQALCLGSSITDLDNIIGAGDLVVTGIDSQFGATSVSTKGTGIQRTATVTNSLWQESTQTHFTVFLILIARTNTISTNHFLQPTGLGITNTDEGQLSWNFPETDNEAIEWTDHGGEGTYELNGTSSDHGFFFSYDPNVPDPPTNLFAITIINSIELDWTAPIFDGFSDLIGYKIERESPIGGGFNTLISNTGNTDTEYTDVSIVEGQEYNYRVRAINVFGESLPSNESKDGTPTGGGSPDDIIVSCDGVPTIFSLAVPVIGITDAILCWNGAILNQTALIGYQVNFTTPWSDDPLTIAKNNTNNNNTQITLSPLSPNTPYSVRVQSWYNLTASNVTNVVNFTTRGGGLEIGDLVIPPDANPLRFDYIFTRIDVNDEDVVLLIEYPNSFDPTCVFDMKFARNNQTFSNITTVPHTTISDRQIANFTFLDYNDEIVTATCIDGATNSTGAYILYQSVLPLKLQIDSFRDGTYGTMGMFGFFDFFTLGAMFFAMIGFNRVHPGVGVIFAMMILGVASYLGFVENIFTTATIGIIMTIVIVAVLVHHRNDVAN